MIKAARWSIWLAVVSLFSACANLDSISRSTQLSRDANGGQTAVHLDVKQRVVIAKDASTTARFMAVCAEPSPDALAAYAQSLGLSVAIPTKGSASGSQASQETAASIGLRTQSITLMRDSLYRVCEAYYNRAINGPQVMQALIHAQDVTVAILAIEQLTGVVSAQQVVLGGNANSVATSQVAYIQAMLEGARENATNRDKELTDAIAARDAARIDRDNAKNSLDAETDAAKKVALEATLNQKKSELTSAEGVADTAKSRAGDAKVVKDAIEKNPTSAISNTSASAGGSGQFGNTITAVKLDATSTRDIAKTVGEIVTVLTQKKYVAEACMAFVLQNWNHTESMVQANIDSLKLCREVLRKEQGIF